MSDKLDVREGWVCPKCKEILNPNKETCDKCKVKRFDEDNTTNDELLLG